MKAHNLSKFQLPAHIAYTRSLTGNIRYNLSHSCAQTLTLEQLLSYAPEKQQRLNSLSLEYAPVQGSGSIRELIADFHQQQNHHTYKLNADDVVTFSGAQEALAAVYKALLEPGDEVVVFTPNYPSLVAMAAELKATVKPIALSFDDKWAFDLAQLEKQLTDKTKLIVINAPHNPTGAFFSSQALEKIYELAEKHNCYLLSDDVSQAVIHNDAIDDNGDKITLSHRFLDYKKAIVVSVMSKAFGLGGVRLGWVVTPNTFLMNALVALKAVGSICTSVVDEKLAEITLLNATKIIANNTSLITANKSLLDQVIDNSNGLLSWHRPQVGLLSLMKVNLSDKPFELLLNQLANQNGVLLLPAKLFGIKGSFVRIGLGQENFEAGLSILGQFIQNQLIKER